MDIQRVSLKDYSSLRIGGEGDLVVVKNEEELKEAVMHAKSEGLRVHVLGGGTNSYFSENLKGYLFVKPEFTGILFDCDTGEVIAHAAEDWDPLVRDCVQKDLWGIENLSHIPGSVGAAPIQNIGAYGVELKDTLVSVRVFDIHDMECKDLLNEECEFGYRDSIFKHKPGSYIIISITLKLSKEPHPVLTYKPLDMLPSSATLEEIRKTVIATRDMKLPDWRKFPNTGSFFKNPIISKAKGDELKEKYPDIKLFDTDNGYKASAAWLIEHVAQAKGVRIGNVGTWPAQPLVLVNYGNADADELNAFADRIQDKIESITGVKLDREVNFVG